LTRGTGRHLVAASDRGRCSDTSSAVRVLAHDPTAARPTPQEPAQQKQPPAGAAGEHGAVAGELLLGAREELGRDDRRGRERDPLGGWPQAVPRLPAGAGVGDDLALVEKALADVEAVGEHVAY